MPRADVTLTPTFYATRAVRSTQYTLGRHSVDTLAAPARERRLVLGLGGRSRRQQALRCWALRASEQAATCSENRLVRLQLERPLGTRLPFWLVAGGSVRTQ